MDQYNWFHNSQSMWQIGVGNARLEFSREAQVQIFAQKLLIGNIKYFVRFKLKSLNQMISDRTLLCPNTDHLPIRNERNWQKLKSHHYAGITLTGYYPPPPPQPWPTNFSVKIPAPGPPIFSVKIPAPGTVFQCKTLAPGSKNETKSPSPGIICLVRMPRYQWKGNTIL